MLHVMDLSGKSRVDLPQPVAEVRYFADVRQPRFDCLEALHLAKSEENLLNEMCTRVARDCDVFDVGERQPRIAGNGTNCELGETGPVLDPIQPLLLDTAKKCAVVQKRRGGIAVKRVNAEDGHRSLPSVSNSCSAAFSGARCRKSCRWTSTRNRYQHACKK